MHVSIPARCPKCRCRLPLVEAWNKGTSATSQGLFLVRTTGLVCPECHVGLVLVQGLVLVVELLNLLVFVGLFIYGFDFLHSRNGASPTPLQATALGAVLLLPMALIQFRYLPLLLRVRLPEKHESVNYPLSK